MRESTRVSPLVVGRLCRALTRRFLPSGLRQKLNRVRESPLAHRFAMGALWSMAGGVGSRALIVVGSVALARVMGQDVFGELGIIQSTVGMIGTLAGFGLGLTATKHVAELRANDPLRAARVLALSSRFSIVASGAGAVTLAFAAPWLATRSLAASHLAGPLRVSALLLFFSGVSGAQLGALAGLHAFRSIAVVNVSYAAVSVPLSLLGAWFLGLEGVVWSLIAGMLVSCLIGRVATLRAASKAGLPAHISGWHQERAILWHFSLPSTLSAALVGPVSWGCAAILVNQHQGYSEMGVFNAANQWFMGLMFLPALVGQAALPLLAEQIGAKPQGGGLSVMRRMMTLNSLVIVPALVLCALSPLIMRLYGPGFERHSLALVWSILTAAVVAVQTPVGQFIAASGRMWMGLMMNLGWATVFVAATLTLAGPFGAEGLAGARLLAYLVHSIWTLGFALRVTTVS
jgi:O-antigen/teichoic acid export membrane protein